MRSLILVLLFTITAKAEEPKFRPEICHPPTTEHYPDIKPPITDTETADADCASNTTEMREKFPNTVEKLYRLEGNWTDANFRKRVRALPKNQQYRDNKGNWIVNDLDNTTVTYRFNANKQGMWMQETFEDKKGNRKNSSPLAIQICKKNDSMFLRVGAVEIPVAFPGKRCMWIGSSGKWWRFWRFQDIHLAFLDPTEETTSLERASQKPTPAAVPTEPQSAPQDILPGPRMDLPNRLNGIR